MDWLRGEGFHRINLSNGTQGETDTHSVSIGLFRDVSNSASLRASLLSSSILERKVVGDEKDGLDGKKIDVVLAKASMLLDPTQALVAANKAVIARERGSMITRSLGAEILYNLATGSKNITESLTRFGLGDSDKDLIAVIVTKEGPDCACAAEQRLKDNIEGKLVNLKELDEVERDLGTLRKAHKLKENECQHGMEFLKSLLISKTASKDIVT